MLRDKERTFTDISACVNELIIRGYCSPALITGIGASAGGLAMAVVANRRPSLFRALVLRVPFLDPLNTLLRSDQHCNTLEFEEWGDPGTSQVAYHAIARYSPYDNIPEVVPVYPSVLLTAGHRDPRVRYWEPAKFAARLRHALAGTESVSKGNDAAIGTMQRKRVVLLDTNMDSGHAGDAQDDARDLAFLLHEVLV
jgi:oligopeptidase B